MVLPSATNKKNRMPNTLFVGKVFQHLQEIHSTNDYALELLQAPAKNKPPEGMAIRADRQSAGRGQFGSRWEAEGSQNLLLSIIFYPTWLPVTQQFYLSMAVALALRDAVASPPSPITQQGISPQHGSPYEGLKLKWPNDLYINDQKAAGILIQNAIAGSHIQSSVVGIGLNVNQVEFGENVPNATSMALAKGCFFDVQAIAERLCETLEHRYFQLKNGHFQVIKSEYEAVLYRKDTLSHFEKTTDATHLSGIIRGVTDAGLLRLEVAGIEQIFDLKALRIIVDQKN
jgi:BirA family transcriptional regulator, biotin operon repressor / biotin---[acetyl-CoA-carboxylase] ligase